MKKILLPLSAVLILTSCDSKWKVDEANAIVTKNVLYPIIIVSIKNDTIVMDKEFKYFYWPSCDRVSYQEEINVFDAIRRKMEISNAIITEQKDSIIFNP